MPEYIDPDEDEMVAEVLQDVEAGALGAGFVPTGRFQLRADLHAGPPIRNDNVTAVAWRYEVEAEVTVWGAAAERGPISIDGATFVHRGDDGELRFSRYIDWHSVFQQLGVAAAGRVVIPPTDTAAG
jgi:hypothetical protein